MRGLVITIQSSIKHFCLFSLKKFHLLGKVSSELLLELSQLQSSLETGGRVLDEVPDEAEGSCGNGLGLVKDEVYRGNVDTQKVQGNIKKAFSQ